MLGVKKIVFSPISPRGMCLSVLVVCLMYLANTTAIAKDSPQFNKYVRVVYFNPADRDCLPGYQQRIDNVMTDVQDWYRSEMKRNGYGPMTFPLERDKDGKLIIHVVKGNRAYAYGEAMTELEIRDNQVKPALAKEGIDIDKEHIVIFQNLLFIDGKKVEAWCPYGGGGFHHTGTACVTDHPLVDPANLANAEPTVIVRGDQETKLYAYVSSMLGGVAHEMGHGFGLPHNNEMPDTHKKLGTALMGSGNYRYGRERTPEHEKGAFLSAAHAGILSSHPLFKRSTEGMEIDPKCLVEDLKFELKDKVITISGKVTANVKPYFVALYNDLLFHASDYDATSWPSKVDEKGRFLIRMADVREGEFEMRMRFFLVNGRFWELPFRVKMAEPFTLPQKTLRRQFLFGQYIAPSRDAKDAEGVRKGIEKLKDEDDYWYQKAKATYAVLSYKDKPLTPIAEIDESAKEVWVSDLKWESASVGWEKPTVNRMPDLVSPFETNDGFYTRGLFAFPPSSYVYDVDGKWKTFNSKYGLQNGWAGAIIFIVKCDGVEKFRSDEIRDWKNHECEIDITGVKTLELIIEDGPHGNWADCGIWFEPKLTR